MQAAKILFQLIFAIVLAAPAYTQSMTASEKMKSEIEKIVNNAKLLDGLMARISEDNALREKMLGKLAATARTSPAVAQELKQVAENAAIASNSAAEIVVRFQKQATTAETKSLENELGLVKLKEIPQLDMVVYKIPANKKLDEVLAQCQQKSFVKYAEPNQTYKMQK